MRWWHDVPFDKPPHCRDCIGWSWGCDGFSRVTGDNRVPLLFVGESSGATEAKRGEPFVGKAGQVLERAFNTAGLQRANYSLTNLLRCQPPDNELRGTEYEYAALGHCRQYLNDTVAERQPRIIVALGELPMRELCAVPVTQAEHRGYVLPSIYDGVSLIGTIHPSRIARGDWYLFSVLMHDIQVAARYAQRGIPAPLATNYCLNPSPDDVRGYIDRLQRDPSLHVSYDCETAEILGEQGLSDWRRKRMVQMQFSSAIGEAIVLPYDGEYIPLAKQIMSMGHVKLGWNSRLSDDLLLKANGFVIGGEAYDCMLMWSHLQPSFASGKDAKEGEDKGVPSRLLNLQSAVSFYYPYEPLYKTTMRRGIKGGTDDTLWDDIRYGGARDTDFTLRLGLKFIATLNKQGLWHGFYRYKHQLGQVLSRMSDRGLPIDRTEQRKLRQRIEWQELLLGRDLQGMIPIELKPVKVYKGFPKDLREAVKAAGLWVKCCKPTQFPDLATTLGYEVNGSLIKRSPFNADSPKQVFSYVQHMVDTVGQPWYIPTHIDTKKPSTNKAGMEVLILATDDATLKQIEKCKKMAKLRDYCGEKWTPDADGRVRAEFRVGATATGQTTATNPPIQTYPKHYRKEDEWLVPTMKRIKAIIKAPPGHVMVETDMRGFHARMQAFLAEDVNYYRLSNIDTHSFLAAHYVGVPDKDTLLQLDDTALAQRLKEIKTQYDYERNYLCKRISFLNQYGGQAEKAATILHLPRVEVEFILNINRQIFKPTFKDLPNRIERMLRRNPRLVTPFGFPRWFWEIDINQAMAFWVASPAHCVIQDAILRLDERGALDKYQAVNLMHDALWWCPREELAEECVAVATEEFERASDVLVNSLGKFFCHADAKRGPDMATLEDA